LLTDPVLQPAIKPIIITITTMARFFDVIEPPSGKKSRLPMIIVCSLRLSTNMTPARSCYLLLICQSIPLK
jgi:hypothetical protein